MSKLIGTDDELRNEALKQDFAEGKTSYAGYVPDINRIKNQRLDNAILQGREADPTRWQGIKTGEELREEKRNRARAATETYQDIASRATPTSAIAGSLVGGFGAAFTDPINIATLPFGATAGMGILKAVKTEALLNAAVEAAEIPLVASWQKELGYKYGVGDAALDVGTAGVAGGAFAGIIRGAKPVVDFFKKGADAAGRYVGSKSQPILQKIADSEKLPSSVREAASYMSRVAHIDENNPIVRDIKEDVETPSEAQDMALHRQTLQDTQDAFRGYDEPVFNDEIKANLPKQPEVLDRIESEINASGFEPETSKLYSQAFRSFYDTQTSRGNIDTQKVLDEAFNKLKIQAADARKIKGKQLFQSGQNTAPTFHSALEKSITDLPQGKGSPDQWAGIIKNLNQKGVKQEEIDWTGVQDWIKEQKGSVTKEQILDYLNANKIEVEEVVKGQSEGVFNWEEDDLYVQGSEEPIYIIRENPEDNTWIIADRDRGELIEEAIKTKEEAKSKALEYAKKNFRHEHYSDSSSQTKFSKYTLPGGENYRELLLTLPTRRRDSFEQFLKDYRKRFPKSDSSDEEVKSYYDKGITVPEQGKLSSKTSEDVYKSSHFDEPNIVAHLRFNERTDAEGNKVMFIEEIQSDWHQEGKKKGYVGGEKEKEMRAFRAEYDRLSDELEKKQEELRAKLKQIDNLGFGSTSSALLAIRDHDDYAKRWDIEGEPEIVKLADDYRELYNKKIDVGYKVDNNALNGVPNAPFKTTWPELAFKRALKWAVENDFDKVAWTTGLQQAERYDLSKQVDEITYDKRGDGYRLQGYKDGEILFSEDVKEDKLADFIGKDIAEKISKNEGERKYPDSNRRLEKSLKGVDLKVGGEGMKGFYDKILPTSVNKLVKKFGGKVEDSKIVTETRTKWEVRIREDAEPKITFDKQEANQYKDSGYLVKEIKGGEGERVHSLEITPAMRESIQQQGLPLFQDTGQKRGSIQLNTPSGQTIINLFEGRDLSTLLHESGHFFLDTQKLLANVESAPAQLKEDWQKTLKWLGSEDGNLTRDQHEKFARGFEAYLRDGKAPSTALRSTFEKFKEWLTNIYRDITELGVNISDEIRGVFDRMLATDEQIASANLEKDLIFRPNDALVSMQRDVAAMESLKSDNNFTAEFERLLKENPDFEVESELGRITLREVKEQIDADENILSAIKTCALGGK
jgi:hypothetical protein